MGSSICPNLLPCQFGAVAVRGMLSQSTRICSHEQRVVVSWVLTPATGQNSFAYGDRKCDEGTIISLSCNSLQRIAANSGSDFDCLVT